MADEPDTSQEFKEFVKFGRFFSTRLVQAIVQARLGREQFVPLPCRQSVNPADWFNVRIDELGDVTAQLRSNITSFPPLSSTLALDFLLQTKEDGILPLETWCINYNENEKEELKEQNGRFMRTELYQQLSVVLRSVIAAARVTPSYRYFVRKQSSDSYVILYRVSESPIKLDFGDNSKKIRIATIASVFGQLQVDLTFRTNMAVERSVKQYVDVDKNSTANHVPNSTPDDFLFSTRIPFGPVPTYGECIAASPDSDAFTCFSTSPCSQKEFSLPSSLRPISSPYGSAHFKIGVSPASSNESFARRGSEEMLIGPRVNVQPSCSLPERTLDRKLIQRVRQTSFPFASLLSESPPSEHLNKHIFRSNNGRDERNLMGETISIGLTNVIEEDAIFGNLKKSSTAPVAVNLMEDLHIGYSKDTLSSMPMPQKEGDSSDDDDDVVFPMTDIFGRVVFGSAENATAGPVELIQQCKIANLHQLEFLRQPSDTDVTAVVDTLAEFENNSKIFDSFVSEISAEREEGY